MPYTIEELNCVSKYTRCFHPAHAFGCLNNVLEIPDLSSMGVLAKVRDARNDKFPSFLDFKIMRADYLKAKMEFGITEEEYDDRLAGLVGDLLEMFGFSKIEDYFNALKVEKSDVLKRLMRRDRFGQRLIHPVDRFLNQMNQTFNETNSKILAAADAMGKLKSTFDNVTNFDSLASKSVGPLFGTVTVRARDSQEANPKPGLIVYDANDKPVGVVEEVLNDGTVRVTINRSGTTYSTDPKRSWATGVSLSRPYPDEWLQTEGESRKSTNPESKKSFVSLVQTKSKRRIILPK